MPYLYAGTWHLPTLFLEPQITVAIDFQPTTQIYHQQFYEAICPSETMQFLFSCHNNVHYPNVSQNLSFKGSNQDVR